MQAVDQAIAYPARKVLHAMMKPSRMTRSLGPTLAAQGTDRDRLVQALLDVEMAKAMGQSQNGSAAIQSMLRNWSGSGSTSVASTTDPNELANVLRLTVYPKKRREASAY